MGEQQLVRDDIDLMDGHWYARQPYELWAWMRENAPVYWDPKGEVWGITKYEDVLAIEKDPKTYSSFKAPRPHGDPLPMMISMDDPLHTRRRKLVKDRITDTDVTRPFPLCQPLRFIFGENSGQPPHLLFQIARRSEMTRRGPWRGRRG